MATYRYGISIDFRRFGRPGSRKGLLQADKTLGTATLIIARDTRPLIESERLTRSARVASLA